MKKLFLLGFTAVLFSCNQNAAEAEKQKTEENTIETKDEVNQKFKTVTVKYIGFEMGDAPYYMFEDKKGNQVDFGRNDCSNFEFAEELPEAEANENNQGWGPQSEILDKWFEISYETIEAELYSDGPVGKVNVIKQAKIVDKH